MANANRSISRYTSLIVLVLAGECVFLLPFVLTRIFRPTFLKVFEISNFELGSAFSIYGLVALISYIIGGPLADRFPAKKLMSFSLLITGILGGLMATIPSISILIFLYGLFGMSTILFFWAAFTKATRALGNELGQGKSFGIVDAGRGLLAALLASVSVLLFELLLPEGGDHLDGENLKSALSNIILLFSGITLGCAILVWIFIPGDQHSKKSIQSKLSLSMLKKTSEYPGIWWQAIIVLCSYAGYKCTDDFSLYASDAFEYDDVEAAYIGTISFWIRPLATVLAGILADRFIASKMIALFFSIMLFGSLLLGNTILKPTMGAFFILSIAISGVGIYGLRGMYFTLFHEAKIPFNITGTAVGLVSLIGFTPDIFMGPLMGYLTDRGSGAEGHQNLFLVLSLFSLLGMYASLKFSRIKHSTNALTQ